MQKLLAALFIVSTTLIFSTSATYPADPISFEDTVRYLQSKLGADVTLSNKRDVLIVETMKNGNPFREDKIFLGGIDYNRIEFNEEEGAILVRCKKNSKGCIDRRFAKKEIKRDQYSRMKFYVGETDRQGFINAMTHLVKLVQIPNYESAEPFEK